jgi:hypothetical protein
MFAPAWAARQTGAKMLLAEAGTPALTADNAPRAIAASA